MTTAYDFSARTIDGHDAALKDYAGKVTLVVNVASKCGFTPQYKGLEAIHKQYKDKGFAVLGFPCDQFGHQEPGDEAEIMQFCSLTYDVSFPMFAKIKVNGDEAHPLYKHGPVGHRGYQVEFHQVPDRQGRQGGEALRLDGQARRHRQGHREAAVGRASRLQKSPHQRAFLQATPALKVDWP